MEGQKSIAWVFHAQAKKHRSHLRYKPTSWTILCIPMLENHSSQTIHQELRSIAARMLQGEIEKLQLFCRLDSRMIMKHRIIRDWGNLTAFMTACVCGNCSALVYDDQRIEEFWVSDSLCQYRNQQNAILSLYRIGSITDLLSNDWALLWNMCQYSNSISDGLSQLMSSNSGQVLILYVNSLLFPDSKYDFEP